MKRINSNSILMILCIATMLTGSALRAYALPPDPQNAALRYYQACLLYHKADDATMDLLSDVAAGEKPVNDEIREYIRKSRAAIKTITEAAVMDKCDWGIKYSHGYDTQLPHLGQMRQLSRLIMADARIAAADGKPQAALEKCLIVRKLSRHVGDNMVISLLVSIAIDEMSGKCMRDILATDKLDAGIIDRVGKSLRHIGEPPLSVTPSLQVELEIALATMTMDNIHMLIEAVNPDMTPAQIKAQIKKLGGEKFLVENRKYYSDFMNSMQQAFTAGKPYAETHKQLADLTAKLAKDKDNTSAKLANITAPALPKIYDHQTRAATSQNALLAGIEIHKIRAETGKLPTKLPSGLPKDLFSGKDFKYERTDSGFKLTCQGKDLGKDEVHSYEFKVNR